MTREEEIYKQSVELFGAVDKQPKNFEGVSSKRQLNIAKEAEERYLSSPLHQYYSAEDLVKAFRDGAEWADMYPVNVWHDTSEEPNGPYTVLCDGLDNLQWVENYQHIDISYANWKNYADAFNINRWAYIKDLLPKTK